MEEPRGERGAPAAERAEEEAGSEYRRCGEDDGRTGWRQRGRVGGDEGPESEVRGGVGHLVAVVVIALWTLHAWLDDFGAGWGPLFG